MRKHALTFFCYSAFMLFLLLFVPNQNVFGGSFRDVLTGKTSMPQKQDTVLTFSAQSLSALNLAGSDLQWGRNWQYIGNVSSYLVPLVGYTKEEKLVRRGYSSELQEQTKLSTFGYILNIGSTVSSIASVYKVGTAGSQLNTFASDLPMDIEFKIAEAGNKLQSYRTLSYVSNGFGLAATIMIYDAAGSIDNDTDEETLTKLGTALGVAVTGLVFKIIAVNKVADAGERLTIFSEEFKYDWQKYYLAESGKNLKKYNENWDTGMGLILSGFALALTSSVIGEAKIANIGGIAGAIMAVIGKIYMDWVAPYSLGAAGNNLQEFKKRMDKLYDTGEK